MADKMSKLVLPIKNVTTGEVTDKEFEFGGGGNTNTFVGTSAEWEALTTEQQNAYDCRVLTDDDLSTVEVIDNLNSDSSTDVLSAKQGKVLKGLIDTAQAQVNKIGTVYVSGNDMTIVSVPAGVPGGSTTRITGVENLPAGTYLLMAPMIFASSSSVGSRLGVFTITTSSSSESIIAFEIDGSQTGAYITNTAVYVVNLPTSGNVYIEAKQYSGGSMDIHAKLTAVQLM